MILESALIPIPSEVIMPFSGFLVSVGKLGSVGVVLAGSFGNLVGSIATYYLAVRVGRSAIIKYGKYVLFKKKHLRGTLSDYLKNMVIKLLLLVGFYLE